MRKAKIDLIDGIEHKLCYGCRKIMPLKDFRVAGTYWDGTDRHKQYCLQCESGENKVSYKVMQAREEYEHIKKLKDREQKKGELKSKIQEAKRRQITSKK